ncbi:MAG: hypothetical protein Q9157_008561 [Trypethelium eluteriae]
MALRHLRLVDSCRTMWIDAICINQDDVSERNEQVRRMRYIYGSAVEVIAWIGPEVRGTKLAFEFMRRFANKTQDDAIEIIGAWTYDKDADLMDAMADLIFQEYWSRVWIVQEVVLAHSLKILVGNCSIDWPTFDTVLAAYSCTQAEARQGILGSSLRYQSSSVVALKAFSPLVLSMTRRQGYECSSVEDYIQILPFWRGRGASDPRDNLFALYGLLDLCEANIDFSSHIDYRMSKKEAYIDFVRLGQGCRRPLNAPLTILCLREPIQKDNELPSWVPDFAASNVYFLEDSLFRSTSALTCSHDLVPPFRCTRAWRLEPTYTIQGDVLIAKGFQLAGVCQLGQACKSAWLNPVTRSLGREEPSFSLHSKAWQVFRSWAGLALSKKSTCGTNEADLREIFALFWSHICSDASETFAEEIKLPSLENACKIATDFAIADAHIDALEQYVESVSPSDADDFGHFFGMWEMITARRRFAVTNSGIFILVPAETEESDLICVLLGSDIPIVLRNVDAHYIFVGACFVDGYMDGKAVDEMEEGKHPVDQFEIH